MRDSAHRTSRGESRKNPYRKRTVLADLYIRAAERLIGPDRTRCACPGRPVLDWQRRLPGDKGLSRREPASPAIRGAQIVPILN